MSWNEYEKAAEKGPGAILWKVFLLIVCISVVLGVTGYIFGWFGEAAKVAQNEFGPERALQKYEWFIDQANAIEKMDQDVILFRGRVGTVTKKYQGYGDDMILWPPHIQAQFNKEKQQADEDLLSVASQRNNLVKEYNAQSGKFNWTPFQTRTDKPVEQFHKYVIQ
ncbi:hypothetical protein KAI92_01295 [Candidatus Parcubacteria bacterium]|nr:hypothetical protein [Candidatus Parcubacteria bacterium]